MRNLKGFLKGFLTTLFMIFCLAFAVLGTAKAYENTVFVAFGAEKSALALTDGGIRILDFEIKM